MLYYSFILRLPATITKRKVWVSLSKMTNSSGTTLMIGLGKINGGRAIRLQSARRAKFIPNSLSSASIETR